MLSFVADPAGAAALATTADLAGALPRSGRQATVRRKAAHRAEERTKKRVMRARRISARAPGRHPQQKASGRPRVCRSVPRVNKRRPALLLLGLWQLCRKPFGEMAAGIGAVLIAGEPFLAALNGMFHTDAFIAYLSMIAYVALCRSLSLFGKEEEPSRFAGLAGVAFGLAILTKLTAVGLVPAAARLTPAG